MMNQEDIFKKIGQILNELNEQYQYLAQNPTELNELELELFLANSSFLSDHVQIVRKLNSKSSQKALPEHAASQEEVIEQQPVIPVKVVEETVEAATPAEIHPVKPVIEEEIFKIDKEPSTFEFILNDRPSTDKFEFEEKSIDEIFDRPLSKEEAQIIAQKQKLRELDSLESELPEEDEIGPEPFLVSEPLRAETAEDEVTADEGAEDEDAVGTADEVTEDEGAKEEEITDEKDDTAEEIDLDENDAEEVFHEENETAATEDLVTSENVNESQPAEVKSYTEAVKQSELFTAAKPVETPVTPEPVKPEPFIPAMAAHVPEEQPKAKPTLNDILSGNTGGNNFNSGAGRMPVTDLKQAISLNDKMRYIKDLFNGYNLAYAEAIDLLNKMPDFRTADAFLQNNYALKNNWAAKQETAEQFYELLNQRFPAK